MQEKKKLRCLPKENAHPLKKLQFTYNESTPSLNNNKLQENPRTGLPNLYVPYFNKISCSLSSFNIKLFILIKYSLPL